MPVEYVEWVDSCGSGRWESTSELKRMRPSRIQTVGFLLDEGEDYITIVQSYDPPTETKEDTADNTIVIPKFAITTRRRVQEG